MTHSRAAMPFVHGARSGNHLFAVGWAVLVVATYAVLLSCGGNSRVDSQPESSGGSGGAGGATTSTSGNGGAAVGGGGSGGATTTTSVGQCEEQLCGAGCQVCEPDCVNGHCDGADTCIAWDFAGSGSCPPSGQVVSGVVCSLEGVLCSSDSSCSGALLCICGQWTLINPC